MEWEYLPSHFPLFFFGLWHVGGYGAFFNNIGSSGQEKNVCLRAGLSGLGADKNAGLEDGTCTKSLARKQHF